MSAAPIPKTAPFGDEEIELLNRVVGPATPIQRAWLAGFLAGVEASSGAVLQPAAPPVPAERLTILFASESGNSEKLASDIAKLARKNGLKPSVVDMAYLDIATLAGVRRLVVIAATWGEGEAPSRAIRAYADLMSDKAPPLDGLEFGVLALGDTAYAEFCAVGKTIDERLAALGGRRVVERVDCDLDFAAPAADWIGRAVEALSPAEPDRGTVIEVDFGEPDVATKPEIVEAEILEHVDLNSSRSDKETVHLVLGFDNGAPAYEPGDALDLYPENDPAEADELLKAAALSADQALRTEFIKTRDIHTLSLKSLETYAALTGHQFVKALIENGRHATGSWAVSSLTCWFISQSRSRRSSFAQSPGRSRRAHIRSRPRAMKLLTKLTS